MPCGAAVGHLFLKLTPLCASHEDLLFRCGDYLPVDVEGFQMQVQTKDRCHRLARQLSYMNMCMKALIGLYEWKYALQSRNIYIYVIGSEKTNVVNQMPQNKR